MRRRICGRGLLPAAWSRILLVTLLGGALSAQPAASQADDTARVRPRPVPPEVAILLPDTLVEGRVTIRFESADSALALALLERLRTEPPLPALPDSLPTSATIFLPREEGAIDLLLRGRRPEWSAALALPAEGWIILPAGRGEPTGRRDLIGEVLRHEWAHLALYEAARGHRAPRWFVEGYAQWAAGWDTEAAWRLRIALALDDDLGPARFALDWPAGRAESEVAYLLAASVVDYLVEASGEAGLALFIERWGASGRFEESLRRTWGVSSGALEEDWAAWARERYGWVYVLTRSGVGWGILAGLLIAMVWARRRYRKDRMAELRAREIPDAPEWWVIPEGSGVGPHAPGAYPPLPRGRTDAGAHEDGEEAT
ncbi:MAG: hypothetical protein RQ745_07145 [Longimicrobiales bacterium]|nr:hypothetical protein [Longimicrobiales bacterium]